MDSKGSGIPGVYYFLSFGGRAWRPSRSRPSRSPRRWTNDFSPRGRPVLSCNDNSRENSPSVGSAKYSRQLQDHPASQVSQPLLLGQRILAAAVHVRSRAGPRPILGPFGQPRLDRVSESWGQYTMYTVPVTNEVQYA